MSQLEPVVPGRPRRRWGRWATAAGTVAAVAATLLVVQFVRDDALPNAAAAARLNTAADNINTVDEPLGPGQCWQTPNAAFLASLPRDPDQLYDRLRDDVGDRGEPHIVTYVADMLRSGLVPADLRAALYRALGKVPGLEITEETANLDGRKGTAFGIVDGGERHDVIIDPATGQFIGERQVSTEDFEYLPKGVVMGYTSVTTTVVDGMGVRPTG